MRRVIFNKKGGVGKSTISCNLAAISAAKGFKTLVIDLDTQGNSTHYLLGENSIREDQAAAKSDHSELDKTLADFFSNTLGASFFSKDVGESLKESIHQTPFPNLDVLPSHPELEHQQGKLESRYKIFKLKEALDKLGYYDHIYIDTPPALNFYTRSALIAANSCLIPFDCDDFSRQALYSLLETVEEIKQDHNAELEVEGIVVNQFQSRAKLPQRLVNELIEEGQPVLKSKLSPSVKVRESHSACEPLIHFSPKHKITEEFLALYDELNG